MEPLMQEANELASIFTVCVKKAKDRNPRKS